MRVWDLHPGYLNRQSLLGEHRELHGVVSILTEGKRGYSHHPETRRWEGFGWALRQRHALLAAEMALRGYTDRTPVTTSSREGEWPATFVDAPRDQIELLTAKYAEKEGGRIPLPRSAQEFWSHHKYSALARSPRTYRELGRQASLLRPSAPWAVFCLEVTSLLRTPPSEGGLLNALQHMWGYVNEEGTGSGPPPERASDLLAEVQRRALLSGQPYLIASTALSELAAWEALVGSREGR